MLRGVANSTRDITWIRYLHSISFVIVCAIGVFTSPIDVACQAGCGPTPQNVTTPDPQGFFSVPSPAV